MGADHGNDRETAIQSRDAVQLPTFQDAEVRGLAGPPPVREYEFGERWTEAVDSLLSRELKSLPTRLLVASERLFDQYDRVSAEVATRTSIAPPLLLLFALLALRLSPWYWIGVVLPAVLVTQAVGRLRAANDLLVEAVTTEVIESVEVAGAIAYIADPRSALSVE